MGYSSTSLIFKYGKPVMAKHTESGTHSAGDVVVIGATPFVAHVDVPQYTGGTLVDALAAGGGVYTGLSDGTPKRGQDVYWDATNKKFTTTSAGNTHFGVCVGGTTGDLASGSPSADGDACDVLHDPNALGANTVPGTFAENTQSTTASLTVSQVLAGFVNSAPAGAVTLTLPTAALLVAGIPGAQVGDKIDLSIENTSGGANSITLAAGTGGTLRGGTTVAQNKSALIRLVLTNVTATTEAYTAHSIIGA